MNTGGQEHFLINCFFRGTVPAQENPRCHGNKAQSMYMSATLYVREHKGATSYFVFIYFSFCHMHCSPQFTLASVSLTVWHACVHNVRVRGSALPHPFPPHFPRAFTGKKEEQEQRSWLHMPNKGRKSQKDRKKKSASVKKNNNFEVKKKKRKGENEDILAASWGSFRGFTWKYLSNSSLQLSTCSGDAAANRGNSLTNFKMAKKRKNFSVSIQQPILLLLLKSADVFHTVKMIKMSCS